MDMIQQYDRVLLNDGRDGCVVEILGDQEVFLVDVGSAPGKWENLTLKRSDIKKVIQTA